MTTKKTKAPARIRRAVSRMIHASENRMSPVFHPDLRRTVPTTKVGTVRLNGGPLVQPRTVAILEQWQRQAAGHCSTGELLDRLAAFAASKGFDPITGPRMIDVSYLLPPPSPDAP